MDAKHNNQINYDLALLLLNKKQKLNLGYSVVLKYIFK